VDVDRFLRELPAQFDDFPLSDKPRDLRFAEVLEAVTGLAQPNNLALLNVAASCLGEGEAYVEGDAFETLRSDALEGRTIGVYYYDNGHEYEQQLDGMRLIEAYLASPALVIVDDTDWERVERAVDDYLEQQPRATEILSLDGKDRGAPQWWEGMRILRW